MELREILADNLRNLMRKRLDLDTQIKIRERSMRFTSDGKGLSQSTIQRILSCQVHAGIDTLDVLASVFNVQPIDLITRANEGSQPAPEVTQEQQTPSRHSAFAEALAGLYDDLPSDTRLRSLVYHQVSGILLNSDQVPGVAPSAAPAATEISKIPHG